MWNQKVTEKSKYGTIDILLPMPPSSRLKIYFKNILKLISPGPLGIFQICNHLIYSQIVF